MQLFLFAYFVLRFFISFQTEKTIEVDKEEARNAFAFLNEIRANPGNYYKELNYSKNLKVSAVKLQWNDTLARVAEAKARDMAERNYFAHVDPDRKGINYLIHRAGYKLNTDWFKNKSDNNFESLTANINTGKAAIEILIIDEGVKSFGHRKHLLGLDQWNSTLRDAGIGFVRCSSGCEYQSYVCVIIAKHDW
jgi:uncharacterized protein YkwD